MIFFRNDDEEAELEEMDDEESELADDILDEVGEDVAVDDDLEGFGLLTEEDVPDEEEEEKDDEEEDTSLDDDAEDVDFDTFDDVDEM